MSRPCAEHLFKTKLTTNTFFIRCVMKGTKARHQKQGVKQGVKADARIKVAGCDKCMQIY